MKKITLLISLVFLLGYSGIAQKKQISLINGKAPKVKFEATKRNLNDKAVQSQTNFSAYAAKQIRTLTTESFEGSFPPDGWTKQNPDGGTGWAQAANGDALSGWNSGTQDVPTGGGDYVAYCTWNTGGSASNDQWFISPQISVISSDSLSFYLWFYGGAQYVDTLEVLISTTGNSTTDFTTQLDLIDNAELASESTWFKYAYSLAPYAGQQIYIAFRERVTDNQNMGGYFALDLFSTGSTSIFPNDISPLSIVYPLPSDLLTATDTVTVNIANLDSIDHFKIPVTCIIDGGTAVTDTIFDTIPAHASINHTFSQTWDFSIIGHIYNVEIYTSFPADSNATNDTLNTTIYNNIDASSISIDMASIVGPGSISPLATVKNTGTIDATFDVTMNIGTYTSTKAVTLTPGNSMQVTFDAWTAAVGDYTIKMYTQLLNDMNNANDTIEQAISVQNLVKAYCYIAYDPTSTLPVGPAYTYLQTPQTMVSLADQSSDNFVQAGTWGLGNRWYGVVYSDNNLVTIDTTTGEKTIIGNTGIDINGIAFDYTTNTLFGVNWNSSASASSLYRINTASGNATLIGTSSTDLLINLACDTLGNLYSVGINDDVLYSVDKTSGTATSIGSIGFDASYAQDMEFDHNTNLCYMADYNATTSAGDISLVNILTGAATTIGSFAGGAEVTGFAIPYTSNATISDASISSIISPSNETSCSLPSNANITVLIGNLGNTAISNISVSYQINSGTPVTETVTGSIPPFGTLSHTFSTTEDLSAIGTYIIKSYSSMPGDFNILNDTTTKTVISSDATVTVNVQTDDYGSETTWELINNTTSEVIATGGPYVDSSPQLYSTNVCISSTDCYTFNIYDSYGDGNCCDYGSGSYEIVWDTISLGVNTGEFTSSATLSSICDPTSIKENETGSSSFNVFPSPAKDIINIFATENISKIKMTNVFGQIVFTSNVDNNSFAINTSDFAEGMYYIQIETEKGIFTKNITIIK
ncbi:MAG TPA: choice-of-anchor J domain-containing protein [Bacteroidales bacterium]|nr:choice-of-anchor J domain-containing protein [Bacteroidales bacterium]HPS17272.1 choice-of-anchor J domain-containing protein [Bacteroidales bacterium]